jgi:pimeloyl-ACP methyl ester carboxylesterase
MTIHEGSSPGRQDVVYLHGNGASGAMWKAHMEALSDFHCLVPDFPGFSRTGDREWKYLSAPTGEVIRLVQERTPEHGPHRRLVSGRERGHDLAWHGPTHGGSRDR